ncbi:MAG: sigma-54-dependent Fis family transcriptional regulator [Candidatus Delongbacteria bacterium]|nr:sigma-54-dependent Fis family transcriptional regulator [Candidatus Delongbacteria bacterium]
MDTILILEDNKKIAEFYQTILLKENYKAEITHNSSDFFYAYDKMDPELVILDVKLHNSKLDGLQVFKQLIQDYKNFKSKVIILSGEATRTEIAEAMKLGAYTFIEKSGDFNKAKFLLDIKSALRLKYQEEQSQSLRYEKINLQNQLIETIPLIGKSSGITKVRKQITRFSKQKINVLIIGETGTGKEIVANNLYLNSSRAGKPFIRVNISGLSDTLIESELFGHKKGSFTGAVNDKKGYFEKADGGILFLDEICSLNLAVQAKILRAIEQQEIQVVGGSTKKVDIIFIFAANRDLEKLVAENTFRDDLFYRLEGCTIKLPPLRERGYDIILFFEYFLQKYSQKFNFPLDVDLKPLYKVLKAFNWPGNVRQLDHFCERVCVNHNIITNKIIINEFNEMVSGKRLTRNSSLEELLKIGNYSESVDEFKRKYLKYHISENNGKIEETARKIGVDRSTIYKITR